MTALCPTCETCAHCQAHGCIPVSGDAPVRAAHRVVCDGSADGEQQHDDPHALDDEIAALDRGADVSCWVSTPEAARTDDSGPAAGEKAAPTDIELIDFAADFKSKYAHGGTTFDEFDELGFARALLARYGSVPAPEAPAMPQYWSVEVHVDGKTLVSIGHNWLSGERALEERDEQTIIGAAKHLLSFVGYGLPPSAFDPDETTTSPIPVVGAGGWRLIELIPKEPGRYVHVRTSNVYRWLPYKPASNEFKRGIKGRWQKHDGYGFTNADLDGDAWKDAVEAPK